MSRPRLPARADRPWLVPALFMLSCAIAPGTSTCLGSGAPPAVRNDEPERVVVPTDIHWPAHYPRRARSTASDGTAAAEGESRPLAEDLLHRFMNLHTAMRYDEALPTARALVAAAPDRAIGHYNLACVLARLRRVDDALGALEKAVECGWRNVTHMRIDPDLEIIREDARFRTILAGMEELIDLERVPRGPLRDEGWDDIARELAEKVPALMDRYHVPRVEVALIRGGVCIGIRTFSASTADGQLVYPLAAPGHLVTLLAAAQLDAEDKLDLEQLLLNGEALARAHRGSRFGAGGAGGAAGGGGAGNWHVGRSRVISRAFGRVAHQHRGDGGGGGPAGGGFALWPESSDSTATLKLLRLAIEMASGRDYAEYCRQRILGPLSMRDTVLSRSNANPRIISPGYSELGTRLVPAERSGPEHALTCTTIDDLARLVGLMLGDPHSTRRVLPQPARTALADAVDFDLGRLGLGVHREMTTDGLRVQVASLTAGTGCLLRWYPDARRGVVVLFNAETGPEAALRIAAVALGGE